MRNMICVVLLMMAMVGASFGATDPRLEQAAAAYKSGDYLSAIDQYEALLKEGYRSSELLYNTGNAYFRSGQLGRAILNYERAAQLSPHDADISHNLKVAQSRITEPIDSLPSFFLLRWWRALGGLCMPDTWSLFGLLLLCAGATGGAVWLWGNSRVSRKWGFITGLAATLLCILPFSLAAYRAAIIKDSGYGIVIKGSLPVLSAPESVSEMTTIHEGTKVQLIDAIDQWQKVELPNGETGWILKTGIEKI